jgi:hypothetical protein
VPPTYKNMKNKNKMCEYKYRSKGWRQARNRKMGRDVATIAVCYFTILMSLMAITGYYRFINDIKPTDSISLVKTAEAETIEMSVENQIRSIAKEMNFKWENYLVKLAWCESRFKPLALNNNGAYGIDRGLFQINDKYHKEVSNECSFSVACSTKWTINAINNGHQNWWVCDDIILTK